MMFTPYQHGVVREIKEFGRFDPTNPQFQNYRYAQHDLNEMVEAQVIELRPKLGVYVPGFKWSKVT